MKIKNCHIKNFTVFEDQEIEFCDGINVIIGANGTGKSHLLKILYALIQSMPRGKNLLELLNGLFKPEDVEISLLFRNREYDVAFKIDTDQKSAEKILKIDRDAVIMEGSVEPSTVLNVKLNVKGIFIPPNDVLAIYPGFTASYEKRELAFDQTYYDICKALSAAPLKKKNEILSNVMPDLESILDGTVMQKGDRFYVKSQSSKRTLEAHLLAEGHRKIATLLHLINNGSIDQDTILFWDEPEANMNPRLIKHIANVLRKLVDAGVQVFLATHDYLLTGELSIAAEYQTQPQVAVRFVGLSRKDDEPVTVQCGNTLTDLQDNPILEEFAAHYDRERSLFYETGAAV